MNPFLQSLLAAGVRLALVWLSGHLGVQADAGQISAATAQILSTTIVLGTALWTVWSQYKAHQFAVTAQSMTHIATREEVNDVIANGCAPSVMTPANEVPKA